MKIESKRLDGLFLASSVLRVTAATPKCGIRFLNWRIRARAHVPSYELGGAGLYGICYNGALIYVGSFLGSKKDVFGGNVIRTRWWAHFGTLTLRGHRLSVPARTIGKLLDEYASVLHPELRDVLALAPKTLTDDSGCKASLNRVLVANENWERFRDAEPCDLLGSFTYFYVRFPRSRSYRASANSSANFLRTAISHAEAEAIERLRPVANKEIPWTGFRFPHSCQTAISVISEILARWTCATPDANI
ncbi:MAG TPA: hypothetical protein VMV69_02350 [Pirellulales bacterium]|nr:hypothetical protein [Pirellulales bacterium]